MRLLTRKEIFIIILTICNTIGSSRAPHFEEPFSRSFTLQNLYVLSRDECGVTRKLTLRSERALGGRNAALGQYPWLANLFYTYTDELADRPHCSGSLISDRHILTAAHCCTFTDQEQDRTYNVKMVRLGEHTLSTSPDCVGSLCAPPARRVAVHDAIIHKQYDFHPHYPRDDICLIRLKTPIRKFNDYVRPICLPTRIETENLTDEAIVMETAGWGLTERGLQSDTLQSLRVPLVSQADCLQHYAGVARVTETHLCAGGRDGEGPCDGDSGGPLMAQVQAPGGPSRSVLLGITSYTKWDEVRGNMCATSSPTVYMKVAHYLPWILDNM